MDAMLSGLQMALTWHALLAVAVGSVVGVIFGAIPGLTFSMALALLLPFTFGMAATPAIALLMGIYIGGMTGGSVSAILIGIPGTPSAAATVFDGYPMALKGQASVALGGAVIAPIVAFSENGFGQNSLPDNGRCPEFSVARAHDGRGAAFLSRKFYQKATGFDVVV